MENGNVREPELTEEATIKEDSIIANLRRNSISTRDLDAAFWQSFDKPESRVALKQEHLSSVNSATNDEINCNNELEDNKHEQLDDELDFILPSPPSKSPGPLENSNSANKGLEQFELPQNSLPQNSSHVKLDVRMLHPPSASDSPNEDRKRKDVVKGRNEPSKGGQATIRIDQTDSVRLLGQSCEPSSDSKTNRPPPAASTENMNIASSSLSERDSYTWSLGSVDLPSMLSLYEGKEMLLWPAEEEFPAHDGFEENIDYLLIVSVGEGAFGKCYMAAELPGGREFCVKKCQLKDINELLVLTLARKESVAEIVQFYGAKLTGKSASIFMEFMAGGTIADLIEEEKEKAKALGVVPTSVISEMNCLWYLENVLKALIFLHAKGIVHRDVKGTFIDIWKTGCFFLEMWNGERLSNLLALTEGGRVHQRQSSCRPEDHIPSSASDETKDFLRLCLGVNKEEQGNLPSAAELLKKLECFPVILSKTI